MGAVKYQKPRSLKIGYSTRDCAIGQLDRKAEIRFKGMIGRAISDSQKNTTEIMVMYSEISYL